MRQSVDVYKECVGVIHFIHTVHVFDWHGNNKCKVRGRCVGEPY